MADPVAEKSTFLRMYMSSHPDTLVAYAKWFGKVAEPITSAEMTAIDSNAITLRCLLKSGSKQDVRVAIHPPLSGYDDVKPRLLEMKAVAQEGLGMIKAPTINTFAYPPTLTPAIILTGLFAYLAYAPRDSTSPFLVPAHLVASYVGRFPEYSLKFVVGLHAFESLYTVRLCQKHKTGFVVGMQYVLSTLFAGVFVIGNLRRRIQAARIDSVMKVQ
ncbi:hypothetical protein E1B28_002590 [Marasmius oreades]|uniref:DUF2470 domain-containing protein n=1 Tax=Marasmius oreades TaxID=181124 RepID=A0A9P7RN13_9AGAR|nr:uncharacterized protein E1B28_002590 [Marasmius oreades]KAG7086651.1 hypothetical protein E1B28_002590 [Marasmius oreades]